MIMKRSRQEVNRAAKRKVGWGKESQPGDLALGHGHKARVCDGDAVGITREIGEDLRGSGKRSLG